MVGWRYWELQKEQKSDYMEVTWSSPPEESEEEVEVDGEGDQLGVDERQRDPGVRDQRVVAPGHVRQVLHISISESSKLISLL